MLNVKMNQFSDYGIKLKTDSMLCAIETKDYFEKMTLDEFKYSINKLMNGDNYYDLECFMYYTVLLVSLENIQSFINDDSVPIEFLERLFIFSYSCIYDRNIENVIDNLFNYISDERLLKLIDESEYFKNNKLLMFYLSIRINLDKLNNTLNKH